MTSGFISLIGRLLVAPLLLGGICLSVLTGIPTASAMGPATMMGINDRSDVQIVTAFTVPDHQGQPECCATARMEHDTKATTPDHGKTLSGFFVAPVPSMAFHWRATRTAFVNLVPIRRPPHQPFSLTGTTIKHE